MTKDIQMFTNENFGNVMVCRETRRTSEGLHGKGNI